ncbi:hypothetical protein CAV_0590 [Campylobacter avium LMG 24591]|uniref:Uncharacterized protein n=1 Tax=Campylobacter avium LMG 24591 TaxID=522484 RepID=A0A222MW29_9BACT|nr:hypothetical protein [Campylobacter avium]ASQ30257.1 hypothetical protein CAV_0590 [Campylobacter avium LMG 24591]OYD79355.1 hypothetical protein CAV8706_0592 [Campylobacter avium]
MLNTKEIIKNLKQRLSAKDRVIENLMEENQRLNTQIKNIVDLHLEKLKNELHEKKLKEQSYEGWKALQEDSFIRG